MKVNNNMQMQSVSKPSFKAIKSVKCEGLYKKFPAEGKRLIDTFKNNSKAMEFCKKYDVNVVFYACKGMMESVESSLQIYFKNPARSWVSKLIDGKQDKIELHGYGNAYDTKQSLVESAENLVNYMEESTSGKPVSGLLEQHLKLKDEEMQKVLCKLQLKKRSNILVQAEAVKQHEKQELENSIKDLIEQSK